MKKLLAYLQEWIEAEYGVKYSKTKIQEALFSKGVMMIIADILEYRAYEENDYQLTQAELNEKAEAWIKMAKKAIKNERSQDVGNNG